MTAGADHAALDAVLGVQLTVAWAGEGRCEPRRLGWWETDLVDAGGGGDLMKRLLPRTHAWAALEAAREAARRVDERARKQMRDPDQLRSIFFLGFAQDEAVSDRLGELERAGRPPGEALALGVREPFSSDALAARFGRSDVAFEVVPSGRALKGRMPTDLAELVGRLAAALVPFADRYPAPFYKVGG